MPCADHMDEKKRKSFLFFGSLFVAVIFLSSYASFGSNGSPLSSNKTTTIPVSDIVNPAFSYVNGTVVGYSNKFTVSALNGTNQSSLYNLISNLEANASIDSFSGSEPSYVLDQGTMNAYNVSTLLRASGINASVKAQMQLRLPSNALFSKSGQTFYTILPNSTYSVSSSNITQIGGKIPLKLSAILYTTNGSVFQIYQNNLLISGAN